MTTTFVELKMRKAELRNKMDVVLANDSQSFKIIKSTLLNEYRSINRRIQNAERRLLRPN